VIVVVVVLVAAAAVGYVAQRRLLGGRNPDDPRARAEGLPAHELIIPVRTLAALLLAFVLLSVYSSYEEAGDKAAAEAGAVLSQADDATLLQPRARTEVLGLLRCYARAVADIEWATQIHDGRPSRLVDEASDRITLAISRAREDPGNGLALGAILGDDSTRIQARRGRLDEGRPSVPGTIYALLLVSVAIMLAGMAALAHPSVRRGVQLGVLVGTTVVFAFTLIVIRDLDRPYSGTAKIEPAAMRDADARIATLHGSDTTPPCDASGRPIPRS
jgi:hypothetical protein